MRRKLSLLLLFTLIITGAFFASRYFDQKATGAPPYGESEGEIPRLGRLSWLENWQRPEGPPKVALQVGHWKNNELPEELEKLKVSGGSSGGGKSEWEVNLKITEVIARLLESKGIEVEILPATVPPSYWADVFIAIHADGSTDTSKSGFKIAAPWRDHTGKASKLVELIERTYQEATFLSKDENITRNMRGYYAFSWWRYQHAIHPMTASAIVETGFLTNFSDRKLLISSPDVPAQGIVNGILQYLEMEGLLAKSS